VAVVLASITAFGSADPNFRPATRGEVELLRTHLELRRQRRRDGMERCGLYLEDSERAQLACDLVLSLPSGFLVARLGVADGAPELLRLLRRLVDSEEASR
jgi:hypothetical protein